MLIFFTFDPGYVAWISFGPNNTACSQNSLDWLTAAPMQHGVCAMCPGPGSNGPWEELESKVPPLGIRILPHLEKSKLNLNLVDSASPLHIIPWKLSVPIVRFDLTSFKKDTTNLEIYKQLYLQLIFEYPLSEKVFTDGSKTEAGVAAAAVSTKRMKKPFICRLPDDSSIYTAELRAILLALKHVHYSKEKSFLIVADSLSSLQSILNLKYDHPVLVQILELCTKMTRAQREIVFIWVPGHVGIRGDHNRDHYIMITNQPLI